MAAPLRTLRTPFRRAGETGTSVAPLQVIQQLVGEYIWLYPGLLDFWWHKSSVPPKLVIEPHNEYYMVRMLGKWGRVEGVNQGVFATKRLAERARYWMRTAIKYRYDGFAACPACQKMVWHEHAPKDLRRDEICRCGTATAA